MKRSLLFAVAVTGMLTAAGSYADDTAMSPRAKAIADSMRTASGTTPDLIDRSTKPGSPKGIALAESLRTTGKGPSIDLAHGPRPTLSPKDPRYDQELRRMQEIHVAPLK